MAFDIPAGQRLLRLRKRMMSGNDKHAFQSAKRRIPKTAESRRIAKCADDNIRPSLR